VDPAAIICVAALPCAFFGAATRSRCISFSSESRLSVSGAAVLGGAFSASLGSILSLAGVSDALCVLFMLLGSVGAVGVAAGILRER
jgi:hypothetical protein